jgi:glycosyltransferase involved in cell wall biosynthesis
MRYAWDMQGRYLKDSGMERGFRGALARLVLHYLRLWDVRTAHGVDVFVANSGFIARRIRKAYRREAEVLYPPVDVSSFSLQENKEDFFLAASRFVPYKKMAMIVEAFTSMPEKKLVVIGDGPELEAAKAVAGPNVTFTGFLPRAEMAGWMQRAKAFVFAAEEDFGIVPVEAMACGTPVIAYRKGGVTESVVDGQTGVFFDEQSIAGVRQGVQAFEERAQTFDPKIIRARAMEFDAAAFAEKFKALVARAMHDAARS